MDILRWSPKQWEDGLARLRAAMGAPAELWEADTGDVITIPDGWHRHITVEKVEAAGRDSYGRAFYWLTWTAPGVRAREWYSDQTQIRMISRAELPAADDDTLADLRAKLTEGTDHD